MSELKVNAITDASGGNTTQINGATPTNDNLMGRNRVMNGAMEISQRGTSAVTASGSYPVDRFRVSYSMDGAVSLQQDSSAPAGFVNSTKVTTTTADASLGTIQYIFLQHRIEGINIADLAWGTASAKTVTLSFWVRSSLTGTFGGSLINSGYTRSYPFSYTISAADTWEQKTITIAGDTTGTWLTDTGIGIRLSFGLGVGSTYSGTAGAWTGTSNIFAPTGATSVVGTNGATWYITGVQLEAGSVATSFERRSYGQELALCQRYYWKFDYAGSGYGIVLNAFRSDTATVKQGNVFYPQIMRAIPTTTVTTSSGTPSIIGTHTSSAVIQVTSTSTTGGAHADSFTANAEL